MAKTAREAMKAKAKRLGGDRPLEKVDSSTFTPPELLNADVKTGLRPISRRQFKKGGKVMGETCEARADRKPRKSGGKAEATEYANAKVNRNVKAANEEREGKKHIGGMKSGGRAKKNAGGGNMPLPVPRPKNLDSRQVDRKLTEPGDAASSDLNRMMDIQRREDAAAEAAPARKTGGRTGKLSGGAIAKYTKKAVTDYANRRSGQMHSQDKPEYYRDEYDQNKIRRSGNREKGISTALDKLSGKAKVNATPDIAADGMKKGGRTKKASGGQTRAAQMMKDASDTAGVPGARMDFASGQSRFGKALGLKKGGTAKHDDAKQDMALIKKMVKAEARTGKAEGGFQNKRDYPLDLPSDEEMQKKAWANRKAQRKEAGDKTKKPVFAKGGEARTARKVGGGVFSGPGYPGKIPGVVPGGRTARATGGKTKGKTNVNIVIAAGKGGQPDMPMPPGLMGKPAGGIPVPVAPPPGAGGPQGGMPMPVPMPMPPGGPAGAPGAGGPPPMARKAGGRISKVASSYKDMEAGSAGGEGRLQKTDIAKKHKGAPAFKKGGKVYRSYKDMDAGSASGLGRLEKTEIASRKR
jgi:hypothetical protein